MASEWLSWMVALVTGSGGGVSAGMGPFIARCLAEAGARVCINDLTAELVGATVSLLGEAGFEVCAAVGDVSDSAQASGIVASAVKHFGRLDILVNNAGNKGTKRADVENTSDEEWRQVMSVNLDGPFFMSRAALPVMRSGSYGRIISLSSMAATRSGLATGACYAASKAGLLGLTRQLAVEVAQFGITVNAILPSAVRTPYIKGALPPALLEEMAQQSPALRMTAPEDVGHLVTFLASREAGCISGASIPIDSAMSVVPGDFVSLRKWRNPAPKSSAY